MKSKKPDSPLKTLAGRANRLTNLTFDWISGGLPFRITKISTGKYSSAPAGAPQS